MSRYFLSAEAKTDLDDIRTYLDRLPPRPALQIARSIQQMLNKIADDPDLGVRQSMLSRIIGVEVRSRLVASYRIFYIVSGRAPQVIAILHTARDIRSIMLSRIQ